jgi:hypothetical protein
VLLIRLRQVRSRRPGSARRHSEPGGPLAQRDEEIQEFAVSVSRRFQRQSNYEQRPEQSSKADSRVRITLKYVEPSKAEH